MDTDGPQTGEHRGLRRASDRGRGASKPPSDGAAPAAAGAPRGAHPWVPAAEAVPAG